MDNNYPNIFGNPKTAHGGYTCGVCFREFVHYNDMAIHERMHLEQMSLASLQSHLLPQFDTRATVLTGNLQANLQPQIDSRTLGITTAVLPIASQLDEKGPSTVMTTSEGTVSSQDTVNGTVVLDIPASYTKAADTSQAEPGTLRTHTELKTPTYTFITSYSRDFQPVKKSERSRSQDEPKASLYSAEAVLEKMTHGSVDVSSVKRQHDNKSLPVYEVAQNSLEKTHIPARSDINIVAFTQTEPRTTLYDLNTLEKTIQLTQFENPSQKAHIETVTLYPENLHVEGYGKRQTVPAPTVIQASTTDYNRSSLSRHDDYPVSNIQYQMPVSSVRQTATPEYSAEKVEMPLSAEFLKKQTEIKTAVSAVSQSSYLNMTSYVSATLACTPMNPVSSSLFRHEQLQSAPPAYQRYDQHQAVPNQFEPENYPHSQYQLHTGPISSTIATQVQSAPTVYFSEPNTTVSFTNNEPVMSTSNAVIPSATAVSVAVASASTFTERRYPATVLLPDGTYYPSGLPLPDTDTETQDSAGKKIDAFLPERISTPGNLTNVVETANNEELNKKKEFVDMIKMVQGERKLFKKKRYKSESSESENNESSYEYKVDIACFICSEEFEKEKKLFKHLHKHRKNGELSPLEESDDDDGERKRKKLCKYCGKQFMRLHQLIEHIRKHTAEKTYECRFCDRGYVIKQRCLKHEATHNNPETGIHCEICAAELEDKALYLYHVQEHILDEDKKEADAKQQEFADMIRSVQSDKSTEKEKVDDTENQMLNLLLEFEKEKAKNKAKYEQVEKEKQETAICRICPASVLKKDFLDHFKSHKIYICHKCKRGFTRKLNYTYHSDTLHLKEDNNEHIGLKKTFLCSICERKFSKKSKLKCHLETHAKEEPLLKCDVCEKPFYNKGDYLFHLNKHDADDFVKSDEKEKLKQHKTSNVNFNKGLKVKISSSKGLKQDEFTNKLADMGRSHKGKQIYQRELRNRDKRKTTDYSWQGLVEENLKACLKDRSKSKLEHDNSAEENCHSKRTRKQVDRYSEKPNEDFSHLRKLRKRKPVNYDDGEDEINDNYESQKKKSFAPDKEIIVKKSSEEDHESSELLSCKVCKKEVPKLEFISHFKSHCLLSCQVCERSFLRKSAYITHLKNIHQKEITEELLETEFLKFKEYRLQKQKEKNEEKHISGRVKDIEMTYINKTDINNQNPELKIQNGNKEKEVKKQKIPKLKQNAEIRVSEKEKESSKDRKIPKPKQNAEIRDSEKEKKSSKYQFQNDTENPFICILCQKRFNKKSSVVNHVKIHFNTQEPKTETSRACNPLEITSQSQKRSKEMSVQNKSENPVKEHCEVKPKIKSYFCGICKKTITLRHNFEAHMKAKHSNEAQENIQYGNSVSKSVQAEPKLQLGVDVRSPPKKRKIFVEDIIDDSAGISGVGSQKAPTLFKNEVKTSAIQGGSKEVSGICAESNLNTFVLSNKNRSGMVQDNSKKSVRDKTVSKSELDQVVCQNKDMLMAGKPGKSYPKFCPVCQKEQKSLRNYTEHLRRHTGEKPFTCDKCQHQFTTERHCKAHMKKFHPNKFSSVKFESIEQKNSACEMKLMTKQKQKDFGLNLESTELKDTVLENEKDMQNQTYKQVRVQNVSAEEDNLRKADPLGLNSVSKISNKQDEPKALDLSIKADLSSGNSQISSVNSVSKETGINNTAFKKCPICSMKIYSKEAFDTHLNSHSQNKPFSCKFCDLCFEEKGQLYDHRKTHPVEKPAANTSSDCSSEDNSVDTVAKHYKNLGQKHTPKAKKNCIDEPNPLDLICKLCYANFMTKTAFDTHLQLHAEEENDEGSESEPENNSNMSSVGAKNGIKNNRSERTDDNMPVDRSEKDHADIIHRINSVNNSEKIQSTSEHSQGSTDLEGAAIQSSIQQASQGSIRLDGQEKLGEHSGGSNNNNDWNVCIDENAAHSLGGQMQTVDPLKHRLDDTQNSDISGEFSAQSSMEAKKIYTKCTDSSYSGSVFEKNSNVTGCPKNHENTVPLPIRDCSVDNRYAGNCDRTVFAETCLNSNIRSEEKEKATFELDRNVKMAEEMHSESDGAKAHDNHKYKSSCVNLVTGNDQKDLNQQLYANLKSNDTYENMWKSTLKHHLTLTSKVISGTYTSAELLSNAESESSKHEVLHERDTGISKLVQSQNVNKMSPETALTKWKQKVESVMISQLELNDKRKLSYQNKIDSAAVVDRESNQISVENVSGDFDKYECRLCSDVMNNKEKFIEHINVHMNELPPYCELCDMYFMAIYPKHRLIEHNRKKHANLNVFEDF